MLRHEYSFQWPHTFATVKSEHAAIRNKVGLIDMSAFGKLLVEGKDSTAAVSLLSTANVAGKGVGSTTYTQMCNQRGGVECDLTVSHIGDNNFYIATPGGSAQHDEQWIRKTIRERGLDCTVTPITDEHGVLSVQGPHSRALMQGLTGQDMSIDAFPFGTNRMVDVKGHSVRVIRLTFVGETGYELHVPRESGEAVYDIVWEAGQKYGVQNVGYYAVEGLSMEKGYRHWHADIRPDDTPLEAGMSWVCKLKTTQPFIGREALERQKKEGIRKRLVYVHLPESDPLKDPSAPAIFGLESLYRDGECVGYLRRACYAYSLGRPLGVGYVHASNGGVVSSDWIKDGKYELEIMGSMLPVSVSTKTPFDPQNLRVKGFY
mmetsp:Transcript_41983/g.119142  ORF Transcript_41983/g.119142 Transcript_41983/m.119142 type:complete len:375 (+) Transcript_41983:1214-2338(+)